MGMWSEVTKKHDPEPCTHCSKVYVKGQWWSLNNYHGLFGYFCPHCFDLVAHDPYRQPVHPKQYKAVLVAQELRKALTSYTH